MIAICSVSALGAGIAMPLMFLVFGKLVGNFTGYFAPNSKMTKSEFMQIVNKNA
jgi:ATP-binding cassette subfamily B (MDR/TAP) protein 1